MENTETKSAIRTAAGETAASARRDAAAQLSWEVEQIGEGMRECIRHCFRASGLENTHLLRPLLERSSVRDVVTLLGAVFVELRPAAREEQDRVRAILQRIVELSVRATDIAQKVFATGFLEDDPRLGCYRPQQIREGDCGFSLDRVASLREEAEELERLLVGLLSAIQTGRTVGDALRAVQLTPQLVLAQGGQHGGAPKGEMTTALDARSAPDTPEIPESSRPRHGTSRPGMIAPPE